MKESELKDLYIDELRYIYDAENQLTKALPKMAKATPSKDLRVGFEEHLKQTEGHVTPLEQIYKEFGREANGQEMQGHGGLVEEGKE